MTIAFYAPMKPPDDPVPSGDRLMSQQLMMAFASVGHEPLLASRMRTFTRVADPDALSGHMSAARAEMQRMRADTTLCNARAWVTYHPYYKAPDLIGPAFASALAIPYVTIEASYAPKRDADAWAPWQASVRSALQGAAINYCFTARDRSGLERVAGRKGCLVDLPPFLVGMPEAVIRRSRSPDDPPKLAVVAMMRDGDKLASYRILGEALAQLQDRAWSLEIVGDGPARTEVQQAFCRLPAGRITWHGELDRSGVQALLADCDIYAWPGIGEAYGLAYLEAAAAGLPAVALDVAGVSAVVVNGQTGWLVAPGRDPSTAFTSALAKALDDPRLCESVGRQAAHFVRTERSLDSAVRILRQTIAPVLTSTAR